MPGRSECYTQFKVVAPMRESVKEEDLKEKVALILQYTQGMGRLYAK